MPNTRVKAVPASEPSAAEEASNLEGYLRQQLEDDVASDAYTECNIKKQEKEIIAYINEKLNVENLKSSVQLTTKEKTDEHEVYLTPKCLSPYAEKELKKTCLSPSTDITKEYYALVPIERNLLDQELNEQDALSNAFQSIIKTQDANTLQISPRNKPTTLSLISSHTSVKHSNSCDILDSGHIEDHSALTTIVTNHKLNICASHPNKIVQSFQSNKTSNNTGNILSSGGIGVEKSLDLSYSPDSLITDDPSSSSDYLSATFTGSPEISLSVGFSKLNVGDDNTKMDKIFTSSDSGLENADMLESLNSHKDVTLTETSVTEKTLQGLTSDDIHQPHASAISQEENKDPVAIISEKSPDIFEMTPITEDLFKNACYCINVKEDGATERLDKIEKPVSYTATIVLMSDSPHNSIMSLKDPIINNKICDSEESENNIAISDRNSKNKLKEIKNNNFPLIPVSPSILDDSRIKNVSYSYEPPDTSNMSIGNNNSKSPKPSVCAWIVDMSGHLSPPDDQGTNAMTKKPGDRICESLKNESKSIKSSENCNKSRSSVDSDSSEKSSHKYFIDLSSLPDPLPPENKKESETEKKNMFSMYIDLGEKSKKKEVPARFSSPQITKKQTSNEKKSDKSFLSFDKTGYECNEQSYTFEKYETLCNDPNISISEIIDISKEPSDSKDVSAKRNQTANRDKKNHTVASMVIEEESVNSQPPDLFVKLSDLDKPIVNTILIPAKSTDRLDVRMTRSIPENNWRENHASTSKSTEIMSSFHSENALSLNRLFPHLKNEFSKSMPGSLSARTQSPLRQGVSLSHGEIDEQTSEMSEISSVQSSICPSFIDNSTTEDTSQTYSLIASCQSRLGQDLLRMFLEEIAPDVVVEVSGKRIKAHKCILSSRCQYFAGILSGGWVESAGNVIILPPFSHNVVQFVLCHIYSGMSVIPDTINIVELATIADMLGLEGLKEAIMFTLKTKYCHHFHKPCQVCIAGVLECFPLTSVYGLDDLYRKCLKWIAKYFPKVWPTKAFATLPKELLEKCYQEQVMYLSTENFIDTVYGCGITVASLQNSRWAENVSRLCKRVMNAAAYFAAGRLVDIFKALASSPADVPRPARHALDKCLAISIQCASSEETCRAYAFLSGLVKDKKINQCPKADLINNDGQAGKGTGTNLLYTHGSCWRLQCEGALVRSALRVVDTQAFKDLPSDLRKRLRELGCITYGAQAVAPNSAPLHEKKSKPHHHKAPKANNSSKSRSMDIDQVRAVFVPYASKPVTQTHTRDAVKGNKELRDFKKSARTNPPKVRTTKAQEERAKFNLIKRVQSQERINSKNPGGRLHAFQNTKPRYLEPKACADKRAPPKKLALIIISSSESSRNSSPIQMRNVRASRAKTKQGFAGKGQAMSQDSLATTSRPRTAEPSTESLSESQASNKYATYTKTRHVNKGSTESMKARSQPAQAMTNTGKTKIPVLTSQISKSETNNTNRRCNVNGKASADNAMPSTSHRWEAARRMPGSLMNATKASQAKMVPKAAKECRGVSLKQSKHATKHMSRRATEGGPDAPGIERSETFLKDEATFGDKQQS